MQALFGGRESMAGAWRRYEAAEREAALQKDRAVRARPSTTATIKSEARGVQGDDQAEGAGAQNEGESVDAVAAGDGVAAARAQALQHLHSLSSRRPSASTDTTEDELVEAIAEQLEPTAQDDIEELAPTAHDDIEELEPTALKAQGDITAVTAGLGLLPMDPKCSRCGQVISYLRAIQKSKATFVCKVCNMRGQQLFRLYGQ